MLPCKATKTLNTQIQYIIQAATKSPLDAPSHSPVKTHLLLATTHIAVNMSV